MCIRDGILLSFFLLLLPLAAWAEEPIKPIPLHVPYDHEKAELGKALFADPNLSADGTVSCASCHSFDHGGADPRPVSVGVHGRKGSANAPTVYNAYFNFRQFWNGRARDLKDQANGPLHNPLEMAMVPRRIEKYLAQNGYYRSAFRKVYGRTPRYDDMLDAVAEFEKALYTPNCKFDRYLRKEVKLSDEEAKGYSYFKTLGCITCHNGINIGGNSYQKLGLIIPYAWSETFPDLYQVTHNPFDKNVYKVPTLRNIDLTAPYFHDGSAATLQETLRKMAYHNLGFDLNREEERALIAFMKTLTGEKPAILKGE
ncbi:cytochrome c peroxidase [Hydrogenimonas sp. SS33]|uniref:cytochrome-c peroxidase n=1 Tax=Hydrogenimonas leucolamina TaxID=2954236 RepID=UPI00336BE65E